MLPLINTSRPRQRPYLTYAIIGVNVLVFLWQLSLADTYQAYLDYAIVPYEITHAFFRVETALDIFRSIFMHGGWVHLISNMLYLWIFGELVEEWMGMPRYAAFYLFCGVMAAFAQILMSPNSLVPMVGASGAIAGIMGGYVVLFPQTAIRSVTLGTLFTGKLADVPAVGIVLIWFLLQVLGGTQTTSGEGGVAFFAHIGGFLVGMGLVRFYVRRTYGKSYRFSAPVLQRIPPKTTLYQQSPRKIIPMQEYRPQNSPNRNAAGTVFDWESSDTTSGEALQRVESTLQTLKEQANTKNITELPPALPTEKPALDLTHLPLPARKREAIRYLNLRRGSTVTLHTDNKMVHTGKISRLTGTQVVLEDDEKNTRWILFTEILKIF